MTRDHYLCNACVHKGRNKDVLEFVSHLETLPNLNNQQNIENTFGLRKPYFLSNSSDTAALIMDIWSLGRCWYLGAHLYKPEFYCKGGQLEKSIRFNTNILSIQECLISAFLSRLYREGANGVLCTSLKSPSHSQQSACHCGAIHNAFLKEW